MKKIIKIKFEKLFEISGHVNKQDCSIWGEEDKKNTKPTTVLRKSYCAEKLIGMSQNVIVNFRKTNLAYQRSRADMLFYY